MREKWMQQESNLYRLLSNILLGFLFLYMLNDVMGVFEIRLVHNMVVLAGSIMFAGFYFLKSKARILWGLLIGNVLLICILLNGGEETLQLLSSYIRWFIDTGKWDIEYVTIYQIINIMAITLFALLIQHVGEKEIRFKLVCSALILCYLIFCLLSQKTIHNIGVVLGLTYILIAYLEWTRHRWNKKKSQHHPSALFWLLPFMAIYILMLIIVPTPETAFEWKLAKELYAQIKSGVILIVQNVEDTIGKNSDFTVAFSGFSEDATLFGNVKDNNKEVMQIDTQTNLKSNIYLTGNVFNEFTGNEWILTEESTEMDRQIDTLETVYAIQRYDSSHLENYVQFTRLHIEYLYINTRYVFAPLKHYMLSFPEKKVEMKEAGDNILFTKKNGYGTEYDLQLLQMNLDDVGFQEMLEDQYGYAYEQESSMGEENRGVLYDLQHHNVIKPKKEIVKEENLNQRKRRIKEIYGQPVTISQEVRDYLDQITDDKETPLEKLHAIESALSQMTYNTSPGVIPQNKEFLDYFLLESKEGYCSYFATAFVLLARAEGIPARYVQGFCVQASKRGKQTISVTSSMAHAWPEVYLDGIGWIPYEPTPSYGEIRNTSWKPITNNGIILEEDNESSESEEILPYEEEELPEVEGVEENTTATQIPFIVLYSIIFIIFSAMAFFMLDIYITKRRYDRMDLQGKLKASLIENMNVLSLMGYSLGEGETLTEIKMRVKHEMNSEVPSLRFINRYEETVYGHREITNELIDSVREEQKELLHSLKQQKGKFWLKLIKLYFMRNRGYDLRNGQK